MQFYRHVMESKNKWENTRLQTEEPVRETCHVHALIILMERADMLSHAQSSGAALLDKTLMEMQRAVWVILAQRSFQPRFYPHLLMWSEKKKKVYTNIQ